MAKSSKQAMDQEQSETEVMYDQLQMALCKLDSKIGSKDKCLLRLILFDFVKTVENSTLGYLTRLQHLEKITIEDVSLIYEILFLMGKKALWTQFRKTLVDDGVNVPDHTYDVKRKSTHFSDFRLMMIEIGQQFTGNLDSLTMMYSVPDDVTGIWMTLLYLEDKMKVNMVEKASLLKFASKLKVAGSPREGRTIKQYVDMIFSSQSTQASEQTHSNFECKEKIDGKKRRMSLEIENLMIQVKKKQDRVETMNKKVKETAEECCRNIEQTGEQLKNMIDVSVSTQIGDVEIMKIEKLENLDQMAKCLEEYSQEIEGMQKALTKDQMATTGSLNFKEIEESLHEVYPESEGRFIKKDISEDLDIVSKYYVDYKPVDPDKCSINRCFDIQESITVIVDLKDSQDIDVSEEHESAPVRVSAQLQDQDKSNDYKVSKIPTKKIGGKKRGFEFKFANTGLWRLCVFVCGEMVSKPIDIMMISNENLKKDIPLDTEELGGHVFDVCFTSYGKCLLACNNTDKIFAFESRGPSHDPQLFSSVGDKKKVANLCCIDDGRVFLTEVTEREILELDHTGEVRGQFGKGDFEGGSPQGITATCKHGAVHVFVSDTEGKCVQHYVNKVRFEPIVNLPTPDKRTIMPWFLDVNSDLQLFICNNKGTSISSSGQEHPKQLCFVEIVDVKSRTLVNSLKCDSAVCIDEKCNVFLGTNTEVKMFDRDLKFIKDVACNGNCSYGLSAFSGCLAVVCPGSIKFYRY